MCDVEVFRQGRSRPEVYNAAKVDEGRLRLVAFAAKLEGRPPSVGETVRVRSAHPEVVYEMRGRVVECESGPYLSVDVEQIGAIERIVRREALRVAACLGVRLEGLGDKPLRLFTETVSVKGLSVLNSAPVEVGRPAKATLDLGVGPLELSGLARVARCDPTERGYYEIGFAFVEIALEEKELLRHLIERIMEQRGDWRLRLAQSEVIQRAGDELAPGAPAPSADPDVVFAGRMAEVLTSPGYAVGHPFRVESARGGRLRLVTPAKDAPKDIEPRQGAYVWLRRAGGSHVYEMPGRITRVRRADALELDVLALSKALPVQRREYFRVRVRLDAELSETGEAPLALTVHNVGGGGVMAQAAQPLAPGARGRLAFRLCPDEPEWQGHVQVARCSRQDSGGFAIGLRFLDPTRPERDRIIRFCAQHLRAELRGRPEDAPCG